MSIVYRRPTQDEMPEFHRVLGNVFGSSPTSDSITRFEKYCEPERLWAAFEADRIVATQGAFSLELTVPGNQIRAGGTSIVTVLPTHRRRGIFRQMMCQHLNEVRDLGEPIAALWASEYRIYGRFGFGLATDQMFFELSAMDAQVRELPTSIGSMRFVDTEVALSAFPAIYEQARMRRPGMFRRSSRWWEFRTLADPEEDRNGATGHKRVVYSRNGIDCGYVLYRVQRRMPQQVRDRWLVVSLIELIAVDEEAELALWRYILSLDLVGLIRTWRQPTDCRLLGWLENQRAIDRRIVDALWVRIVDLPGALTTRRYELPGEITFAFEDQTCPWNTGTYRMTVDENGSATVAKTEEAATVNLTPQALGAIYLGGKCLRDLAIAGFASGQQDSLALLDKMFHWHPAPWCQEVF